MSANANQTRLSPTRLGVQCREHLKEMLPPSTQSQEKSSDEFRSFRLLYCRTRGILRPQQGDQLDRAMTQLHARIR